MFCHNMYIIFIVTIQILLKIDLIHVQTQIQVI